MTTTNTLDTSTVHMIDYGAEKFLDIMVGRSLKYIGAAMLIRAHLLIAENNRLKPVQIEHLLHVNSTYVRDLIDQVIEGSFKKDAEGYIYSTGVDQAVDRYEAAEGFEG